MRCVAINGSGYVVDVVPQPSDVSTCTLVLAVPAEVAANPFALSLEDASSLSGAMLMILAVAWCLRMLRRTLDQV